jgi:ankyrin repeat protein
MSKRSAPPLKRERSRQIGPVAQATDSLTPEEVARFSRDIQGGNIDNAHLLLPRMTNAQVAHANENGKTALMFATVGGSDEIVELLLVRLTDAQVAHKTRHGNTALTWAIHYNDSVIVRLLLDRMPNSADVAHVNNMNNRMETALTLASDMGNIEIVRLLVARMTDEQVAYANGEGDTALIISVRYHSDDIVRLLLARMPNDADVARANRGGDTALILASRRGKADLVKLLLARLTDAQVEHANGDEETALTVADDSLQDEIVGILKDVEGRLNLWVEYHRRTEARGNRRTSVKDQVRYHRVEEIRALVARYFGK